MTTPADVHDVRDPELPGRLLTIERDALLPLLRSRPDADFALPVAACPGWSVRDMLAHCSAALIRVVENRFEKGVFSPSATTATSRNAPTGPTTGSSANWNAA